MTAMSIQSDNPEHGFQFPGIFEISAMGAAEADLHLVVPMVLEALGLTIYRDRLRVKPSAKGNYVSVTLVFEAHSREDYDAAHGALREHPAVKWTL
jgi:putative lipoic acid-binding regulatory protein